MKFLSFILLSFLMVSCGESPLWNHDIEKSGLTDDSFSTEAESFHFKKAKYSFSISWISGPIKGENTFLVKSWSDEAGSFNGPYQDLPEKFHVYLWMPDMGHGSAPVKIKKIADGEYEISNAYFIMSGTWELHFQLLKNDAAVDEVVLPLTL